MLKFAVSNWAYLGDRTLAFEEVLSRLSELGIRGLELSGSREHHGPDNFPTKETRKAWRRLLDSYSVEPTVYCVRGGGNFPSCLNLDIRTGYLEWFEKGLRFCADCEIRTIRVDTIVAPMKMNTEVRKEAVASLADTWRKCAIRAQEEGIEIVWEFEPGFIFNRPKDVLEIVTAVDHPNFNVLFDPCHAQLCCVVGALQYEPLDLLPGEVPEFARRLAGRISAVHIADSDNTLIPGTTTSHHVPLGRGVLALKQIIEAIISAGFKKEWWTIDLCMNTRPFEFLYDDLKYLKQILANCGLAV